MANQDTNGYMNYGDDGESDFKRKGDSKKEIRDEEDDGKMFVDILRNPKRWSGSLNFLQH